MLIDIKQVSTIHRNITINTEDYLELKDCPFQIAEFINKIRNNVDNLTDIIDDEKSNNNKTLTIDEVIEDLAITKSND